MMTAMMTMLCALILMQDESKPPRVYLGVTFADEEALEIGSVVESAPAGKAGLKEGDRIVSFGGKAVSGFDELMAEMRKYKKGDKVVVTIQRDGKPVEVTLELAERRGANNTPDGEPRPGIEEPAPKLPPPLKEKTVFTFEALLQDFESTHRWQVADGVLTRNEPSLPENALSIALWEKFSLKNGSMSVKLRATQGEIDQAAGIVFRARDASHYYVARANVLEGNVKLYSVRNGLRKQIKSAEVSIQSGTWYVLRIEMKGTELRVSFDGKEVIQVQDSTFADGKIGLWSKADSVAQFDDWTIEPGQ